MSARLQLYTFKLSLWAAAARLAINELNVPDVKQTEVDLSKAENFSPEFLKINPNHTVPALEINEHGSKRFLDDTKSVVEYLDKLTGGHLYPAEKQAEIDRLIQKMHGEADVGNPLFFTSGHPDELKAKKDQIVSFLEDRIKGWETYATQAPEHKQLYEKNIQETKGLLAFYTSADPEPMFGKNKQLWEAGSRFLDELEAHLKQSGGDYLLGEYTVADIHLTPYLHRLLLVRKPEEVFANRPTLKAYYERVQARPSFKKTFQ
ncbi:Glutathione S-transferase TCHQD [Choanephora cucurbitarum]|uniref:Glutathione S-transferase TCHQD n=1 Tax=Choanephora cucurbitarum TaxID=101091 RepID=A0A1C7N7H0_9FUNG|nr:Glutathione S-transferase TCHQD [Choanephora cucurbitarum]